MEWDQVIHDGPRCSMERRRRNGEWPFGIKAQDPPRFVGGPFRAPKDEEVPVCTIEICVPVIRLTV